jgi:hypothetical protein
MPTLLDNLETPAAEGWSRPVSAGAAERLRRRLRYRGSGLPPRSRSYHDFGLRVFYDLMFPHIRARRRFFNGVSGWLALGFGVLGALLGWGMAGPFGVVIGFGAAVTLGANYLTRNRYVRR